MAGTAFHNRIVAGETLVIDGIESTNYVAGVSGWRIAADGSSEFNDGIFRGSVAVGNPATGEVIIDDTLTTVLAAMYAAFGAISAATIRMLPGDGSYYYRISGFNAFTNRTFTAAGFVPPGATLPAQIFQTEFSLFNPATNLGQTELLDISHDSRMLINANFVEIGNGLSGNTVVDGTLVVGHDTTLENGAFLLIQGAAAGSDVLQIFHNGGAFPTTVIDNSADVFFGSGSAAADTKFGRDSAQTVYSDPIIALDLTRNVSETWHGLAFAAGWANQAGGVAGQYRLVAAPYKCVQLVGELAVGVTRADGTVIATLPVGYRPTHRITVPIAANPLPAGTMSPLLQVQTSGAIQCFGLTAATGIVYVTALIPLDA